MTAVPNGICRAAACRAPILWVSTETGRKLPLDPDPVPPQRGALVFVEDEVVRGARVVDVPVHGRKTLWVWRYAA